MFLCSSFGASDSGDRQRGCVRVKGVSERGHRATCALDRRRRARLYECRKRVVQRLQQVFVGLRIPALLLLLIVARDTRKPLFDRLGFVPRYQLLVALEIQSVETVA